jgi:flagellar biosynthesis chaperone FliJ
MARRSRLAVLIRLAELEEHRRLTELGGAARRAADCSTTLTALESTLRSASEARFAALAPRSAAQLVQAAQYRSGLERSRVAAEQRARESDRTLEAARLHTAAARHRLRAIQKVADQRARAQLRIARRRQQRRQEAVERALREGAEHARS